mgnify:FL=1
MNEGAAVIVFGNNHKAFVHFFDGLSDARAGQTFAHSGLSHQSDQGALVLEGCFLRFGVYNRECGGEQEGCGIFLSVHGGFFGIEVVGAGGNLHEVFCGGNNTKPAGFQV